MRRRPPAVALGLVVPIARVVRVRNCAFVALVGTMSCGRSVDGFGAPPRGAGRVPSETADAAIGNASEVDASETVRSRVAPTDARGDGGTTAGPSLDASAVVTDWCIEGLTALDEDVCYVLPPRAAGAPTRLLIYLHGIIPPTPESAQKRTVQSAVRNAALRAGAAAIVPRGRRGIGPAGARDHWVWPTSATSHAALVSSIVARWIAAKHELEAILGAELGRTYLTGSSNGAYFVAALALRGDCEALGLHIDGYGAMSGGSASSVSKSALARVAPTPLYVGFGAYDETSRGGGRALATLASAASWPVLLREHPFGHGAREIYLDEAFAFWDAAR